VCGGFTGEKLEIWKIPVGEPSRASTIPIWIGIKSISHSRAEALLLHSKHKHMQKFIQNTMALSWTLLIILSLLIICGEPPIGADPDLEKYHRESQILFGIWVVLLQIAVIFTCIKLFIVSRGRWRHS